MKSPKSFLKLAITPFILLAAVSLFVLDQLNVNVDHLTSYMAKDF